MKVTELSELVVENLKLRQINIDIDEERDTVLTQFSECNNVMKQYANFLNIFDKNRISRKGGMKKHSLKLL